MPTIKTIQQFPRTRLPALAQAMVVRAVRAENGGKISGAELVTLRRAILAGAHDDHPAAENLKPTRKRLMGLTPEDMPPDGEDVWLLIETLSQRHGGVGHAASWQLIGINPNRGRDLLARSTKYVDWPVWFTLRYNALGR